MRVSMFDQTKWFESWFFVKYRTVVFGAYI